jgi:NADH:ubiquinone oxidoreductase subunit F (NADH-binding)/(2Fe-2S) ferredoxin
MIRDINGLDLAKKRGINALYPDKIKISVGMATCGLASGAQAVYDEIKLILEETKSDILLSKNGCLGFCQAEPIVDVYIPGRLHLIYKMMTPQKVKELLSLLVSGEPGTEDLLCILEDEKIVDDASEIVTTAKTASKLKDVPSYYQIPFFAKQKKIVLRNCGFMDPGSLDEYIGRNGYYSLSKALKEFSPQAVIDEIKKSGLRGRGGAGFPTGKKWELCKGTLGEKKYIICNADEGDPGAYMDRSILEGDPHSVLEGMIIGAYAMGANKGFIYVRTEYPLAIARLRVAIKQAKEYGFIGENIFGSGFNFDLEIREGSGAFVCGEETALIHSLEGNPPEPRQRPPFPAQKGLWGYPTVINNVETLANIPLIIQKGGGWFFGIGTEKSKGTKVFSVVGKIKNTGLVEVPMGIRLREIIYDLGGGILEGKKLKAVQTGGPSGGCIPESLMDLPVDYESLKEAGSIMGSGGMVVMDEDTCMVDMAKFFLAFTSDESCGKCSSCRDGSRALLLVLTKICEGKGEEDDLVFLEELSQAVKNASLCGLGQTLSNPVISTIKYFRQEYEAHIRDKCCPAGVCKEMISYYIDPQKCKSCAICAKNCPVSAIDGQKGSAYLIEQMKCTKCGVCLDVCPQNFGAVVKASCKAVPV